MTSPLTKDQIIAHCASRSVTCADATLDTGVWVLKFEAAPPPAVLHRIGLELKELGARWITVEVPS
jgi:hypothetical protein